MSYNDDTISPGPTSEDSPTENDEQLQTQTPTENDEQPDQSEDDDNDNSENSEPTDQPKKKSKFYQC